MDNKQIDKKKLRNKKGDYRPKRVLQNLFKYFERCMHDRFNDYSQNIKTDFEKVLAENIAY